MAEKKTDSSSSSPSPSLSDYRWSRDEIPLSRREGEEVLAERVRKRSRTPPSPLLPNLEVRVPVLFHDKYEQGCIEESMYH